MMKEADYIRATHLARIRIVRAIMHDIMEEGEGIPLDVSGITADEYRQIMILTRTMGERLEKATRVQ